MESLRKEYGDKMFDLDGIGEEALDMTCYSHFFGNQKTAALYSRRAGSILRLLAISGNSSS